MPVPNTFANATTSIPLSQLDANFATPITLGNTAIQLGNTVTTLNNMTLSNVTITTGNVTVSNATVSGNLAFTGTGNRITGDFSNATLSNRVYFQTSTLNSNSQVGVLPNGTGNTSNILLFNSSDPANASFAQIGATIGGTEVRVASGATGTGTVLPMTFITGSSERMRITSTGDVGIGTSAPARRFEVLATGTNIPARLGNSQGNMDIGGSDGGTVDIDTRNWPMALKVGSVERMRIDASGNVGIGTSSPNPAFRLDVSGIGRFTGGVTINGGNALQLVESSGNNAWNFNNNLNNLTFTYNATEYMRIDGLGRVGIGTSSPQSALDVQSNSNYIARFTGTSNGYLGATIVNSNSGSAARSYLQFGNNASQFGAFITLNSSTNTTELGGANALGIYNGLAAPIAFATAGLERMRIDASGNVGIGTSSPSEKLDVVGTLRVGNGSSTGGVLRVTSTGQYADVLTSTANVVNSLFSDNVNSRGVVGTVTNHPLLFFTGNVERARVTTGGELFIGKSAADFRVAGIQTENTSTTFGVTRTSGVAANFFGNRENTLGDYFVSFYNGAAIGSITTSNGTSVNYTSASDYRLKENVVPLTGAAARVQALKPSRFNFIAQPNCTVDGFIAHEAAEVVPEAVSGEKDAVNEDGSIKAQGIDHSKLVPLLTAALQEALTEIASLKARVAALENK